MGPTWLVMVGNHSSRGAQPSSEAVTVTRRVSYVIAGGMRMGAIEMRQFIQNWYLASEPKTKEVCGQVIDGAITSGYEP